MDSLTKDMGGVGRGGVAGGSEVVARVVRRGEGMMLELGERTGGVLKCELRGEGERGEKMKGRPASRKLNLKSSTSSLPPPNPTLPYSPSFTSLPFI